MRRQPLRASLAAAKPLCAVLWVGALLAAAPAARGQDAEVDPDQFVGGMSVDGDLAQDEAIRRSFGRRDTLMDPWFAWKSELRQNTGLVIGGSYGVLWQSYSNTPPGVESNAVGHKFTFNLSYDLLNRGAPDALTFDMAVEDRRPLGTDRAPLQAGIAAGSAVPTAATWGDFSLGITQAYVRQNLFQNRFQYTVGKIFAPNFVNAYPFFDDNRQFLSLQFSTSPTIAVPLRGFGGVAAWYPQGGPGLYMQGGMFTPYSSDTGSTIGDFFGENDYFYSLDFGFSALAASGVPINARGPMDRNNISMTVWYRDPLNNGSPRANGVAFNANWLFGENFMPFLRGGWSDGWQLDRNVSLGLGWRPPTAPADLLGVAIGWTRPANTILREQVTSEVFYRWAITPNLAITPVLQLVNNPALNPREDQLWVFSLRGRLAF
ncbi:carbohydrate porin [Rivibacter subsaxonicus]|uniref:Carbohydrate-selective porin OprB n=1 Tax=Rivibacter subsaxonicus TaxID=457575 RepID=A0A4Q7V9X5_9BURK|nr:carbohydrate porin [Rivibacter subsaxonicus]RZT91438.1 carbohydrate-selective porin OprB [Rivibacter subsaxonicus]